jgi:manganese-dependent inorganic pyrophosphatase
MDAIGAAYGYAELKNLLDLGTEYLPVRLGDPNPQTEWVLEQAGVEAPRFLPHIRLRAEDLMKTQHGAIHCNDSLRAAGLAIDYANNDLVPVTDDDGVMVGVVTTKALARRYVRDSRTTSTLHGPTSVKTIAEVMDGELLANGAETVCGRIWAHAIEDATQSDTGANDVVVVGDRSDAQMALIERGVSLLIISNGQHPTDEVLAAARAAGTVLIVSPLDTYVSARFVSLAEPCNVLMGTDAVVVTGDELLAEVSDQLKDSDYATAVVVDESRRPIGLISRADMVAPERRKVVLVDHAEIAQSVPGIEEADVVEILDHHHIGTIETRNPIPATFDPIGCTSTLVTERFRAAGHTPSRGAAILLLGAILSDTVIMNSPTTTGRDVTQIEWLGELLDLNPQEFGREMFEAGSDVSGVPATELVRRDAKPYQSSHGTAFIVAQVEVIGDALLERKQELLEAMREERVRSGAQSFALMVTDVIDKATELLVDGDLAAVARAFGVQADESALSLPGVMSRKKQVAPKLLATL